jgi:hypothetical protein
MSAANSCRASVVLVLLAAPLHLNSADHQRVATLGSSVNAQSPAQSAATGANLLSANALYREFQDNPVDATDRYAGRAVELEGLRGEVILLSGGVQAAVHVAEGRRTNALILSFPDRNQLRGINRGQRFRFKCVVEKYEYSTVWMEDCSIENSTPAASNPQSGSPVVAASASVLSANALYREFQDNEVSATNRHVGRAVTLEGLRGDVIPMSDGVKTAVHIADRAKSNALILLFSDRNPLRGVEKGQRFRFRCTVEKYEYLIVWMEDCSLSFPAGFDR